MTRRFLAFVLVGAGALGIAALFYPLERPLPPLDPERYPGCVQAAVPAGHIFVAATASDGATLSNVTIGADQGKAFAGKVVRVVVAPGERPITLVAAGISGTIWQFEGAVARVQRVVALSRNFDQRVATGGIPADRVEFFPPDRCGLIGYATQPVERGDTRNQQRVIELMFGRRADHVVAHWKPRTLVLPDATFEPRADAPSVPENTRGTRGEREMSLHNPGGMLVLDPASLISPRSIAVSETLPAEGGLVQLERSGAIRPPRPEEVARFIEGASAQYRSRLTPDYRMPLRFDYVITRAVTLPASLFGAQSKRFLVLEGVSPPGGDRAHSCIAMMDGFRMEEPSACLGRYGTAMEKLANLPATETVAACRLWELPAAVSLEAVSVYGPQGGERLPAGPRVIAPIVVHVQKPGDVVLVLSAYQAAVWRIQASPRTRIAGVIVIGYDTSLVQGVTPETEVRVLDHKTARGRKPSAPDCFRFYEYLATGYEGGPDAMMLDRQVEVLTGRRLDGLRGARLLSEATVR